MFQLLNLLGFALFTFATLVAAIDKTKSPELIARLTTAATNLDRQALLQSDKDWLFDFNEQQPFYNFAPGGVINMNAATFPAARGNGMTLAMLNLGPCSMLPPHYHPRASNYVVATQGNTTTYMFGENGARLVQETLLPGRGTIFPQGSMHMMVNNGKQVPARRGWVFETRSCWCMDGVRAMFLLANHPSVTGCDNAQLVSALNSEDAGTVNIGQVFTNGFPFELVNTAFGQDLASDEFKARMIPIGTGSNWGRRDCLRQCGIEESLS